VTDGPSYGLVKGRTQPQGRMLPAERAPCEQLAQYLGVCVSIKGTTKNKPTRERFQTTICDTFGHCKPS
jgi:hypothetical protein